MGAFRLSYKETSDVRLETSDLDFHGSQLYVIMKSKTHNFKRLEVWQRARRLVKEIYGITNDYPPSEKFGLTSQTRRCAISIPSNIAEGCGRNSDKQMAHFCSIARGSSFEIETHIILGQDLDFIQTEKINLLLIELSEIQRMLDGLISTIEKKIANH